MNERLDQPSDPASTRPGRADRARARLETTRQSHGSVDTAVRAYGRDSAAAGAVLSSALAFALFLVYLPLSVDAVAIARFFPATHGTAQDLVHRFGVTGIFATSVGHASQAQSKPWLAAAIATAAVLFGISSAAIALRVAHQLAWGLPIRVSEHVASGSLRLLTVIVTMMALVAVSGVLRGRSFGLGLAVTLASMAGFFCVWVWLSWNLPHRVGSWRALIPGALLLALGMQAIHVYAVYFLPHSLTKSSQEYGTLGPAFVLLTVLYIVGRLMMASPVLNAARLERRELLAAEAAAADAPQGDAPPAHAS